MQPRAAYTYRRIQMERDGKRFPGIEQRGPDGRRWRYAYATNEGRRAAWERLVRLGEVKP